MGVNPMNQIRRNPNAINRDILKILMKKNSDYHTIRNTTLLHYTVTKSTLYTLLKYRLVQLIIKSKTNQTWSITAKGREYYTKMNHELDKLDNLLKNAKTQNYQSTGRSYGELILIDLKQGNNARRAIIEELENN